MAPDSAFVIGRDSLRRGLFRRQRFGGNQTSRRTKERLRQLFERGRFLSGRGGPAESCGWTRGAPMRCRKNEAITLGITVLLWVAGCGGQGKADPKAEAPPRAD